MSLVRVHIHQASTNDGILWNHMESRCTVDDHHRSILLEASHDERPSEDRLLVQRNDDGKHDDLHTVCKEDSNQGSNHQSVTMHGCHGRRVIDSASLWYDQYVHHQDLLHLHNLN